MLAATTILNMFALCRVCFGRLQLQEAEADARRCITVRPGWGKAFYRLASCLLAQKKLGGAVIAANTAEKLEAVPLHIKLKKDAVDLLRQAVTSGKPGADPGADENEETANWSKLVDRFRSAEDDTALRVRRREVAEQEARDAAAAQQGLDGTGEVWRKETPAEYAARRERLVRLEKINRGELTEKEALRTEEEEREIMDHTQAFGKQGMTTLEQNMRAGARPSAHAVSARRDRRGSKVPSGLRGDGEDRLWK